MSYRVEYPENGTTEAAKPKHSSAWVMVCGCLLAFLLLVNSFWPRGAQVLRGLLLPGNPAVTVAALEDFATDLRAGESLTSALEEFCRSVIREAELAAY